MCTDCVTLACSYWLNVCEGLHGSVHSPSCAPSAAACMQDAVGQVFTLGLVQTQNVSMAGESRRTVHWSLYVALYAVGGAVMCCCVL